jgi:release factor glutamine methyltransferase
VRLRHGPSPVTTTHVVDPPSLALPGLTGHSGPRGQNGRTHIRKSQAMNTVDAREPEDPGRRRTLTPTVETLAARLSTVGFLAATEEAAELLERAAGDVDLLYSLLNRRLTGEPLAWITGRVSFCGLEIRVHPGVYVPRRQSEPLARRAVDCLPVTGVAIDLCTGAGAIARVLTTSRPGARIVASDIDERAVACAAENGVEVYCGDLFAPLPGALEGAVDVIVGVVPYVPTSALSLLQRDTFAFESSLSYDGGDDGTEVLRRVLGDSIRFLRQGGTLLLELGGEQADALGNDLSLLGYMDVTVLVDEDGDTRGIEARLQAKSD